MSKYNSVLRLDNLVYDRIEFERKGFKNSNKASFGIQIQIGEDEQKNYKVTLTLKGEKPEEYELLISVSGFFMIEKDDGVSDEMAEALINSNAVAILMPYLRSELTLLTSQPGMDSVVLPPFNINKMLEKDKD